MRHIKTFGEIATTGDIEKIDEGWKEMVIAGALSLLSHGVKAQKSTPVGNNSPQKGYNIQKKDTITTPTGTVGGYKSSNILPPDLNTITVNFSNEFQSGAHRFDKTKTDSVENKLKEIANFLKTQSKNNIVIEIEAQESQVPNKDIETGSRLERGQLALKRANNTKDLITSFIKTLNDKGEYKGQVKIDTSTSIGKTPYKVGESPRQDKFTSEQFVKVKLTVKKDATTVKDPYAAYAYSGDRIFTANPRIPGSNMALGDVFYKSRSTQNIENGGEIHGQDLLLRTVYSNEKKYYGKEGQYDGKKYLIPQSWWNQNVGNNNVSTEKWDYIQANFEVK